MPGGHGPDADPEPGIVLPLERALDALEPVVAAGRARAAQPEVPHGRATSSDQHQQIVRRVEAGSARSGASAAPLRFMYVCGLRTRTGRPSHVPCACACALAAARTVPLSSAPARWSANRNPALCRVPSYSGPGLPSPTMACRAQAFSSVSPSASAFGFRMSSGSAVATSSAPPPPAPLRSAAPRRCRSARRR